MVEQLPKTKDALGSIPIPQKEEKREEKEERNWEGEEGGRGEDREGGGSGKRRHEKEQIIQNDIS